MSVGASLSEAREASGLSVEEVSATTRIRAGLIRAIEADDFSGCGGGVYARGHIRSIARAVGVDPEPLVADFDREHGAEAEPPAVVPGQPLDPDAAHVDRRGANWPAAMAVALVVICILAGVSLVGGRGDSPQPTARDEPTVDVTTTPTSSPTAPASPPPSAIAHVPTDDQAVALIRVTSSQTWMSVRTLSGKVLFEGLLGAGARKVFHDAKGLELTIGNAPAVELVANGTDIGTPKSEGNVAHITIERGGDVQYG